MMDPNIILRMRKVSGEGFRWGAPCLLRGILRGCFSRLDENFEHENIRSKKIGGGCRVCVSYLPPTSTFVSDVLDYIDYNYIAFFADRRILVF